MRAGSPGQTGEEAALDRSLSPAGSEATARRCHPTRSPALPSSGPWIDDEEEVGHRDIWATAGESPHHIVELYRAAGALGRRAGRARPRCAGERALVSRLSACDHEWSVARACLERTRRYTSANCSVSAS